MAHMVQCVKLGRQLPGLERPPYPGELGQRIFDNVSQEAWEMWKRQAVILINHYGLSLMDAQAQKFLREQMEDFFFGAEAAMPEGWSPAGAPTKGAPRK